MGNFDPCGDLAKIQAPRHELPQMRRNYMGQDPFNTRFPSVDAACDWLASLGVGSKYRTHMDYSERDYGWAWNHNTTQAMSLIKTGWQAGAAHVKSTHVNIANTYLAEHEEESTRYDVAGSFVDVGTFLSGVPECMVDFCQDKRETRGVRIMVDMSISGGIEGDMVFKRGIAIMGAVLAVQASGVAVTVDLSLNCDLFCEDDRHKRTTLSVTAHKPGDVLDTSRLAYFLAHPAFTRLIMLGGLAYGLGGASNGCGGKWGPKLKQGEVWIQDLYLGRHPWGSPESNATLIESILSAAV